MKFKCISSGCIYNFESALDIKSMKQSLDYEVVVDAPAKTVPVGPTTVAPVKPNVVSPGKPLITSPIAPKAS